MGIVSQEAFGTPRTSRLQALLAVASLETCGRPTVNIAPLITAAGAIPSAEAFGSATVTAGAIQAAPTGGGGFVIIPVGRKPKPAAEPRQPLPQTVTAAGIVSLETVGRPSAIPDTIAPDLLAALQRIARNKRVRTPSIPSREQVGDPTVRQLLPLYQAPPRAVAAPRQRPAREQARTPRRELISVRGFTTELPRQPRLEPTRPRDREEEELLILELV